MTHSLHATHSIWDPDAPPHRLARFAESDDVRIHYLDTGPVAPARDLDPIVFVPGLTCVADDYIGVVPVFARRILVIDLRGRGRSGTPPSGYHRDDHVRDLGAVVEHAGIGRFHLMMFSRGTAYGLPYAFEVADRVRSLSIGDYIGGEIGIDGGAWAPSFVAGRWRGTPVVSRIDEVALAGIARESVERRYYDELEALGTPTLVVRSGQTTSGGHTFVNAEEQAGYRRAGAEIVTFEASSHDLFRRDPARFPSLVESHVEAAEAAGH